MRSGTLGDVMLKLVLRSDPTKHIAEVSQHIFIVSLVIDKSFMVPRLFTSVRHFFTIAFCLSCAFFALIVDQIQVEVRLVDMARETAGGHRSYT